MKWIKKTVARWTNKLYERMKHKHKHTYTKTIAISCFNRGLSNSKQLFERWININHFSQHVFRSILIQTHISFCHCERNVSVVFCIFIIVCLKENENKKRFIILWFHVHWLIYCCKNLFNSVGKSLNEFRFLRHGT